MQCNQLWHPVLVTYPAATAWLFLPLRYSWLHLGCLHIQQVPPWHNSELFVAVPQTMGIRW